MTCNFKKEFLAQVVSCEFSQISKNTFLHGGCFCWEYFNRNLEVDGQTTVMDTTAY